MGYQLEPGEVLSGGIRRIAGEQVEQAHREAVRILEGPPAARDAAVHEVRKSLKKVRAVLQLVRPVLGPDVFERESGCFREAGRLLAPVRESLVAVHTLDHLAVHAADRAVVDRLAPLRARLGARHAACAARVLDDGRTVPRVVALIAAAQPRVARWPVAPDDYRALSGGLGRVYRRGRRSRERAEARPTAERFHTWRKQVKYLLHQMHILQPVGPAGVGAMVGALDELAAHLGLEHDLAELRDAVLEEPGLCPELPLLQLLLGLVEGRRAELQAAARRLGAVLYAEAPDAFVARLAACGRLGQDVACP